MAAYSNIYYIVVLAWGLRYFIASFNSTLPWSTCDNWWNTDRCIDVMGLAANGSTKIVNATDSVVEYWE